MTGVLAPLPDSQERQAHTEQQCGVGFRDDVERPGLKKTRGRIEQSGIEEDVFAWTAGVITDCQGAGAWGIPSEIDACEQDVVAAGAVRQEVRIGRDPEITRSTPETGKRDSGPEAVGRPVRARRCFGSRSRSYVPFRVLHDQRLPRYPRSPGREAWSRAGIAVKGRFDHSIRGSSEHHFLPRGECLGECTRITHW